MHEGGSQQAAPDGARCATHAEVVAPYVCARCGDYACPACAHHEAAEIYCAPCYEGRHRAGRAHYGPATLGQRFANYLIDTFLGTLLVGALLAVVLAFMGLTHIIEDTPVLVFDVLLATIYYVAMEGLFGRTLGKLVTGTAVVTDDGRKPGFGRVLVRTLSRFVPFEALSFWISNAFWHDSWTKTSVVRLRPNKADAWRDA